MEFRFDILVTVNFRHAYYPGGRFTAIRVKPDDSAAETLQRLGLLFKPFEDGFRILYDTHFAGRQRSKEEVTNEAARLRFHFFVNDQAFFNYTANLQDDISSLVFYFSNAAAGDGPPLPPGLLHPQPAVSGGDQVPAARFSGQFFSKPSGIVDLELRKGMEGSYSVNFSARATFWRYILVGDHLKALNSPAILDEAEKEDFDGPANIRLPDNREAQVFTSRAVISLSGGKGRVFRLVENYGQGTGKYRVVVGALPSPDVGVISAAGRLAGDVQKEFSEIFIY